MVSELLWLIFGGGYIAGRCLHDKRQMNRKDFWWTDKNYNLERQGELERMCIYEREKVNQILGRQVDFSNIKCTRDAVEEMLNREGYDYHDPRKSVEEWAKATGHKYRKW